PPGRGSIPEATMSSFALPAVLWLTDPWHDALALIAGATTYRPAADLSRFAFATPAARRHYLPMVRARHRWRWIGRRTGLAQPELAAKHRPAAESRALLLVVLSMTWRLLALTVGIGVVERTGRIHYPRAKRWRLTDYGWQCVVKTAPRTGRREVEK